MSMRIEVTSMGHATKIETPPEDREADNHSVPSDGTIAKRGATVATSVGAVRAAEALVRRDIALIRGNGGENECAHAMRRIAFRSGRRKSA
jgi:hypothetical protein